MNKLEINYEKNVSWLSENKMIELLKYLIMKLDIHKIISIYLCDNETIKELNKRYRNKDYPTDVLSFVYDDEDLLGEIIISLEKCEEQAVEYGVTNDTEFKRLLVHGILHLLGYDHELGKQEAEIMFGKEDEILKSIEDMELI